MSDLSRGDAPVIRVVKKKKGKDKPHGGAWKVAYADFVTAMMAFFLVMWILGLSKPARDIVAAYFRDPNGFMKTTHGGTTPFGGGDAVSSRPGKPSPLAFREGSRGGVEETLEARLRFKAVQDAIEKELKSHPEFITLQDSVQVHMTSEGLRIELIEKTESLFFDTGSAVLKPRTVQLLRTIAPQLAKLQKPVVIEGHTDSRPLDGPNGYSNWELSADRANAARRAMEDHGLPSKLILAVRGYADHKLLRPDDPLHFSNRRVSILVPYSIKGL
jgi:chemotaxis protein MotB